jgi:hypothetical protein
MKIKYNEIYKRKRLIASLAKPVRTQKTCFKKVQIGQNKKEIGIRKGREQRTDNPTLITRHIL